MEMKKPGDFPQAFSRSVHTDASITKYIYYQPKKKESQFEDQTGIEPA